MIFYFDPVCPFCWITSRWLLRVSGERDINIEWKIFSLALKNNELVEDNPDYSQSHLAAHRLMRVMQAASKQHAGSLLIDMYTSAGIKHHIAGDEFTDELIESVLIQNNLPASLLEAADDTSYDEELQQSINSATQIAGEDIGVPTIVFKNENNEQQGFFGPVLQTLPEMDEALELWDGLSKLATNSSFYELKRSRPNGDPDIISTAKC